MKKIATKILLILSYLVPIQKVIVLESNPDISDNTEALYKEMVSSNINKHYKLVWLIKNPSNATKLDKEINVRFLSLDKKNLVSKLILELKLFYLFSSCEYYFFSHVLYSKSVPKKGQRFVFLTHGVHFKRGNGRHFNSEKVSNIITTSVLDNEIAMHTYQVLEDKCIISGYPRNDVLFSNSENAEKMCLELEAERTNTASLSSSIKRIIWLPTFRRHNKSNLNDGDKTDIENDLPLLKNREDFEIINKSLIQNNTYLYIKPHPAQNTDHFNTSLTSNIIVLSDNDLLLSKVNLYQLLSFSDVLLTDYSSVFIDFLLTGKHIIFTTDDIESYSKNPGFYFSETFSQYMPGSKVKNISEFIHVLSNLGEEEALFKTDRDNIRDLFHENKSPSSAMKILRHFGLLEGEKND